MTILEPNDVHPAWLPPEAFRVIGSGRTLVRGDGPLIDTVRDEVARACARYGGGVRHSAPGRTGDQGTRGDRTGAEDGPFDLVLALSTAEPLPAVVETVQAEFRRRHGQADRAIGDEGFVIARHDGVTVVLADEPAGLLYGLFHVVRLGAPAFGAARSVEHHRPAIRRRMLDHWDNVGVHPVMGQVERGYAGGSIFWRDGARRGDLSRVRAYGRLLAACGVNAVAVNNVNVHAMETHLLTDRLGDVAAIAGELRPYGIRVHLSANFASPVVLGGLPTADPLDEDVRKWWVGISERVYETIPDFGGYVVKADSEGQPGPFAYGRTHAEGANVLAEALAPFGGVVHWRAFVYDHRQDWRDRSTDRARAAYDHFAPPRWAVQGQRDPPGEARSDRLPGAGAGVARHRGHAGHPLAQANLYAFGRLAWAPWTDPVAILDEWIDLTFAAATGVPEGLRRTLHAIMNDSWRTYERYTAPLGVGFMVRPGDHYGPDVDGYEYTPWGTYHFADRDGVGVDRTRATGTGFTGQYPPPWSDVYESLERCPDELLLFFHHVPYEHVLHNGSTVIQHIYDTHFAGVEQVAKARSLWEDLAGTGSVPPAMRARVKDLLDEQLRCAQEWRDQINAYFLRKSGVPDAHGRRIP